MGTMYRPGWIPEGIRIANRSGTSVLAAISPVVHSVGSERQAAAETARQAAFWAFVSVGQDDIELRLVAG